MTSDRNIPNPDYNLLFSFQIDSDTYFVSVYLALTVAYPVGSGPAPAPPGQFSTSISPVTGQVQGSIQPLKAGSH